MHKTFQLDAEGQVYVVKENGRLLYKTLQKNGSKGASLK